MENENFKRRTVSSAIITAIMVLLFVLRYFLPDFGMYLFDAALLTFIIMAIFETAHLLKLDLRGSSNTIIIITVCLCYVFFIIGMEIVKTEWWLITIIEVLIVAAFAFYVFLSNTMDKKFQKQCALLHKNPKKESLLGSLDLLKTLLYPVLSIFLMIVLNHFHPIDPTTELDDGNGNLTYETYKNIGTLALMLIFAVSFLTDTASYLLGVTLGYGTKKLVPKISPHKTYVGAVGGIFGGILASLLVLLILSADPKISSYLTDNLSFADIIGNPAAAANLVFILIGIFGAVATIVGGFFASFLKRKYNTKDFGSFISGHGGIMDRLDGILFNSVFIFIIMLIIEVL
ncbi:MAG: phosphatidate cytidylyltransferase [Christensenellaceae bacterium]|nr:phosphatidate cytidylyltransferase [Christensenellaceae bacterium]